MPIVLRPITDGDTDHIVRWRNSEAVRGQLFSQEPITPEQHRHWLETMVFTGKCRQYVIVLKETDSVNPIGTVFLKNFDFENQKAELGILIGEASTRGKGYAGMAVQELLKIAFLELNLKQVYLMVFADNLPAVRTYQHAGFQVEGIFRKEFSDSFKKVLYMGISISEWMERTIRKP